MHMSHHGITAGPICPKFCTQIHLGPEILKFLNIFLFGMGLGGEGTGKGRAGEERGWEWDRMGWDGRGGIVKLSFHFLENLGGAG